MSPLRFDPEDDIYESLQDQEIQHARVCDLLGIDPEIGQRELISWVRFDDDSGVGINAMLTTYSPEDGEPFVASLAVYESFRNDGGKGVDSYHVATLDFGCDENDPDTWIVQDTEVPEDWHYESVAQALRRIRHILKDWPMQREER